jgi:hypothetical protein
VNESVLSSNRGDGKVVENAKSALSSIDESISKLSLSAQKSLPIVGSDAGSFKNLFGIRDARFEILELQKQVKIHFKILASRTSKSQQVRSKSRCAVPCAPPSWPSDPRALATWTAAAPPPVARPVPATDSLTQPLTPTRMCVGVEGG